MPVLVAPIVLGCKPVKSPIKITQAKYITESVFVKNEAERNKYLIDGFIKNAPDYYEMITNDNKVVFVVTSIIPYYTNHEEKNLILILKIPTIKEFELLNSYDDYIKIKERSYNFEKTNESINILEKRLKTVDFNTKSVLVWSQEEY